MTETKTRKSVAERYITSIAKTMNYVALAVSFFVLIVLYFLYTYMFVQASMVSTPRSLNKRVPIDPAKLKFPNSSRYYYEAWIWIDDNTDTTNVLFDRLGFFAVTLRSSTLSVYSRHKTATPSADDVTNGVLTTPDTSYNKVADITTAFPFQKWVQFVMNVDGSTVDLYLEGRLVKSQTGVFIGQDATTPINIGNPNTYGQIKNLVFQPVVTDPPGVWSRYAQTKGMAAMGTVNSGYNVDLTFLKDNANVGTLNLL